LLRNLLTFEPRIVLIDDEIIKDIKSVIGTIHFKHFFPKKSIVEVNSVSHAALELVKTMQRQMIDIKKKVEIFLA